MSRRIIGYIPKKTKTNKTPKAQQPKADEKNDGGQAQNQEPENQQKAE